MSESAPRSSLKANKILSGSPDSLVANKRDNPLPKLEGFLGKKQPNGMKRYQRRWIVVKGAYILWAGKQIDIVNDASREERRKFRGSIHLMNIENIKPYASRQNNKFIVTAKDAKTGKMRDYQFETVNQLQRDFWVTGLKQHKQRYQTVMRCLGR